MNEIEYKRGIERQVCEEVVSKDKRRFLKHLGNGIVIGFIIMFIGFILIMALTSCNQDNFYGIMIVFVGVVLVMTHGIIYDYNGGYEAGEYGVTEIIKRREFIDLINTKTGKINRLFVEK